MTDQYWVVGNPINHSKSPAIHQAFAQQCQQSMSYQSRLLTDDNFESSLRDFFSEQGKGANVTVPFKERAYHLADCLSTEAVKAGAVNTLALQADGRIKGYNTDGLGLVTDFKKNLNVDLKQKRILILGAGGAVRGVIEPILAEKPNCIHLYNRTRSKADLLAELFGSGVLAVDRQQLTSGYDVIINGTSASLSGQNIELPDDIIASHTICYDMMYAREQTPFIRWALNLGAAQGFDGLGMLVEQASEAFQIWRNCQPDTAPILKQLRQDLQNS